MSSWRTVDTPSILKKAFAAPSNIQIMGLKIKIKNIMGRTILTAMGSAFDMAKRLGIKSANNTKTLVTKIKDNTEPTVSLPNKRSKYGLTADSPMTPAKIATALSATCTTVIKLPGCSCMLSTSKARTSPSFAMTWSLILREDASASSELETIALSAINMKINRLAVSKLMTHSDKTDQNDR